MRIPREVRGGPRFFFFFGANRAARDALAAAEAAPYRRWEYFCKFAQVLCVLVLLGIVFGVLVLATY